VSVTRHWDVAIVGAGQTAPPLAERLVREGRRVVLIERQHVGGTCVNYGCTPTKTLVASARAAHVARTASRLGVHTGPVEVDFAAVMARKSQMVLQWRSSVERRMERAGDRLTLLRGHARFVGERALQVDGDGTHTADLVVLNTGARAAQPAIEGLADVPWLDNVRLMELDRLPEHLLVVGGGFIGCEFAQIFRRFGSEVTIVQPGDHLLGREDEPVSSAIEDVFRREGIAVLLGEPVTRLQRRDGGGLSATLEGGREVSATHVLVAVGRTPNTEDLGCDRAGVRLDPGGCIVVDDDYRTSAEGVFATGDVSGGPQFTHSAWDDHRLLFDVLTGRASRGRSGRLTPHVTFTDPQVAGVGLTEREARKRGVDYELASLPFGHIARAIETDETDGVVRILVDPSTEHILGATIVGAEAGELIHVVQALMLASAPAHVLVHGQIAHPTFAEGLQSALMRLERFSHSP